MKRDIFVIIGMVFFISCKEIVYKENHYTFQLPQEDIFVKTSKRPGGKFVVFFAKDSLDLDHSKDSIEFRTGENTVTMAIDSTNVYLRSLHPLGIQDNGNGKYQLVRMTFLPDVENMGCEKFNIKIIPDSIFNTFYELSPSRYTFIRICTRGYCIFINKDQIKEGNIYGE